MQRNKVAFDSADALTQALNSPVRHDMRADFKTFPRFQRSEQALCDGDPLSSRPQLHSQRVEMAQLAHISRPCRLGDNSARSLAGDRLMAEPSRSARIWYQSFVHPIEHRPYIERLAGLSGHGREPWHDVRSSRPRSARPAFSSADANSVARRKLSAMRSRPSGRATTHLSSAISRSPAFCEIRGAVDIPVIGLAKRACWRR